MSGHEQHGRNMRRLAVLTAVLLVLGGATAITVALATQVHAPQPAAAVSDGRAGETPAKAAEPPNATDSGGPTRTPTPTSRPVLLLPAAEPTHLDIPAIGVSSGLLQLGQNPDGTVQVPPLARDSKAGWYRYSPTPGERGPAVLLGHVDSAEYGPGVFFKLGALRPRDTVTVTRADHTAATFRVTRVTSVPKDRFPTLDVYGNTDDAELRLITCGGAFDPKARSYLDNIVVYAVLTGASS
jgi:Sortase domain